jgi:hypothetical protein
MLHVSSQNPKKVPRPCVDAILNQGWVNLGDKGPEHYKYLSREIGFLCILTEISSSKLLSSSRATSMTLAVKVWSSLALFLDITGSANFFLSTLLTEYDLPIFFHIFSPRERLAHALVSASGS